MCHRLIQPLPPRQSGNTVLMTVWVVIGTIAVSLIYKFWLLLLEHILTESLAIFTGVIQLIPPVLSSQTLLHILLSSEYSGFRPSTTAVVTISAPVSVSTGPKFRRYSAQLSWKIVKKVFIVISNVFPTFLTYR